MGLRTQKATERFKAMKSQIREAEPFQSVLKERKITDPRLLIDALDTMDRTIEWENVLHESTATPEQFNMAMVVIKAMNGDDPKLLKVCYDELQKQVQAVGQKIGIVGAPDALESYAAHPDIQNALADGSITPAYAQELVQQRAAEALRTQGQQRQVQSQRQSQAQHEAAQAEETAARAGIDELSNQLKASDPDFAAKLAILTPQLPLIVQNSPPSQWVAKIAQAYAITRLPAPAPVARVRPGHMPMRPAQPAPSMQPDVNRGNAFRLGVAAATQQA
jgi:beta-phosphoglucomutase-like phosphatase (HAD superfamily)